MAFLIPARGINATPFLLRLAAYREVAMGVTMGYVLILTSMIQGQAEAGY